MNPLIRLEHLLPQLTNKELAIAEYILKDPTSVVRNSAEGLVKKAHSSKSAFIRMCQKLGYAGYAEFRFACSSYIFSNTETSSEHSDDPIQNIITNYANVISQLNDVLDRKILDHVADLILKASKVKTYGLNRTKLPTLQLQMRGIKIGLDFEPIFDAIVFSDAISVLGNEDVCLYFSMRADIKMHKELVQAAKASKCKTVLITMATASPILKSFDYVITLPSILDATSLTFLDNQAIFFIFVEILLNDLARKMN